MGYGSIPMKIAFLLGWTSINPSYFDVNYRGTRVLTHCHIIEYPFTSYDRVLSGRVFFGVAIWISHPPGSFLQHFGARLDRCRGSRRSAKRPMPRLEVCCHGGIPIAGMGTPIFEWMSYSYSGYPGTPSHFRKAPWHVMMNFEFVAKTSAVVY